MSHDIGFYASARAFRIRGIRPRYTRPSGVVPGFSLAGTAAARVAQESSRESDGTARLLPDYLRRMHK